MKKKVIIYSLSVPKGTFFILYNTKDNFECFNCFCPWNESQWNVSLYEKKVRHSAKIILNLKCQLWI